MIDIFRGAFINVFVTLGGILLLTRLLPMLSRLNSRLRDAVVGGMFGLCVVASMTAAFPIADGIYGDMRNAIIAVAALSAGPIAAIMCAAVAAIFRLSLGGHIAGALIGLALCTLLSLGFRALPIKKTPVTLATFGIVLAAVNAAAPFIGPVAGIAKIETVVNVFFAILLATLALYPLGIAVMTTLITRELARLDAELKLLSRNNDLSISERRFRDVFDLSCVPMAWVDLHSRQFVRVNREYELLTGYRSDELLAMTVDQLSTEENRVDDIATLQSLAKGDATSLHGERLYRRKDGSTRWGSRTLTAALESANTKLGLAIVQDITDRKRSMEQIAFLAEHDPLTALENRFYFTSQLGLACENRPMGLAVLLIDLDDFKAVNDTRGHAVGDEVLLQVASTLRSNLRKGDVVARIGGDEFAVMRVGVTGEEALGLANQLISLLGKPSHISGQVTPTAASIGVSIFPADGTDPAELLKKADIALYASKADGKSTAKLFDASMAERIHQRETMRGDLATALASSEFEVEYQPLVNFGTSAVSGFEALVRWNHPTRGRVSPAEFVPLLEQNNAIVAVGTWVLNEACSTAAGWPGNLGVAVNVSVRQFEATLPLKVAAALSRSGLRPDRLQLEITESVLMEEDKNVISILQQIKDLGVTFALDDFGTGYSSLSYLQKFPFDKLKIDRSFVSGGTASEQSGLIAHSIVQLGHSLGMRVTAEGIETSEQLERMRRKGCDEGQGYFFSKAVPAKQVAALLDRLEDDRSSMMGTRRLRASEI